MSGAPLARRRLLVAAAAGSAATLLAACGGDDEGGDARPADLLATTTEPEPRGTAGSRDVALLNGALDGENRAIAAYEAAGPRLRGGALAVGRRLLDQEREHADALAQAIRQLGGIPRKPEPDYELPRLGSQAAALRFAAAVERDAIASYLDALPRLSSPDLRGTAAAIVTDEAEHLAVLLGALGLPQLPEALVGGRA